MRESSLPVRSSVVLYFVAALAASNAAAHDSTESARQQPSVVATYRQLRHRGGRYLTITNMMGVKDAAAVGGYGDQPRLAVSPLCCLANAARREREVATCVRKAACSDIGSDRTLPLEIFHSIVKL